MAKSKAEMMKAMRARRKSEGLKECTIFAPPELHLKIKKYGESLMKSDDFWVANACTAAPVRVAEPWEVAKYGEESFEAVVDGLEVPCQIFPKSKLQFE